MSAIEPVVIPSVPNGPAGLSQRESDAMYYREAAYLIRWHAEQGRPFAGSNLTEAVAQLCEAAAAALVPVPGSTDTAVTE